MKTATVLLIALNLQFAAFGFALFVAADAWRHTADQQLRAIEIQLDFAREQNELQLEHLFRRQSQEGGSL